MNLREALLRGGVLGEVHTTRSALAGLARLNADEGRLSEATMLLGFVEEMSRSLDVPVSDRALESREAERADLRNRLGEEFDVLWERGRSLNLAEATRLALSHPEG